MTKEIISKEKAVDRCLPAIRTILLERLPSRGEATKMSEHILEVLGGLSRHVLEAMHIAEENDG